MIIGIFRKAYFSKIQNHLIILDNAGSRNNELIKNAITKSDSYYLCFIPYTPKPNAIINYDIILYPLVVFFFIVIETFSSR